MNDFNEIKKALVSIAKSVVNQDVYFESVPKELDTYWFIDIRQVLITAQGSKFKQTKFIVDITCSKPNAENTEYMVINMYLDALINPCFSFGSRKITIEEANMNIVDHLSHYIFTVSYIPDVDVESGTPAEHLEVKY